MKALHPMQFPGLIKCLFAMQLEETDHWEDSIDAIIKRFEKETGRNLLYTICFN